MKSKIPALALSGFTAASVRFIRPVKAQAPSNPQRRHQQIGDLSEKRADLLNLLTAILDESSTGSARRNRFLIPGRPYCQSGRQQPHSLRTPSPAWPPVSP